MTGRQTAVGVAMIGCGRAAQQHTEAIGLLDSFWLVAVLLAVAFAAAGSLRSRR